MSAESDILDPCSTASKWDSFNPVIVVEPKLGYFTVPVFTVNGLAWKGSSYVAIQFDYTIGTNFSFNSLPTKPNNANFILCVRWRVGTTVYRYKLWDHPDGILFVPIYNGELIGKNFVLEIWTVSSSTTVSLGIVLNIISSLFVIPDLTDCCADVPNANLGLLALECSGITLFNAIPAPIPFPNTSCEYWFDNIGPFKAQQLVA